MNEGYNRLLRTIGSHVARQTRRADFLELGTIGGDMSLKLDRFSKPIPEGEYMVTRTLLNDSLVPGDRVLVAWVNDGTDPVVIDVVR